MTGAETTGDAAAEPESGSASVVEPKVPAVVEGSGRGAVGRPGVEWADPDPNIARVYDYCLGGKDNFVKDRELGDAVAATAPWILDTVEVGAGKGPAGPGWSRVAVAVEIPADGSLNGRTGDVDESPGPSPVLPSTFGWEGLR